MAAKPRDELVLGWGRTDRSKVQKRAPRQKAPEVSYTSVRPRSLTSTRESICSTTPPNCILIVHVLMNQRGQRLPDTNYEKVLDGVQRDPSILHRTRPSLPSVCDDHPLSTQWQGWDGGRFAIDLAVEWTRGALNWRAARTAAQRCMQARQLSAPRTRRRAC